MNPNMQYPENSPGDDEEWYDECSDEWGDDYRLGYRGHEEEDEGPLYI